MLPEDWHRRYAQQARWTESLRAHLFQQAGLQDARRLLEVGCGSGVICRWASRIAPAAVTGLDLSLPMLRLMGNTAPETLRLCADGLRLPFADSAFDAAFCHFLLLWVGDALQCLREMRRVVRPGGPVLALAEPDYGGRIDYPYELEAVGRLQAEGLRRQGADPETGRRLAALFHQADLQKVTCGALGGEWGSAPDAGFIEEEWCVLRADLAGNLPAVELLRLQQVDADAWRGGERILFVPTFYAVGWK